MFLHVLSRWNSGTGDLTENKILLDRRILDYIVGMYASLYLCFSLSLRVLMMGWLAGLDSEINELVEGSDLYTPNIPLDSVVLAREHKALLLSQCAAYDVYVRYRHHLIDTSIDKVCLSISSEPFPPSLIAPPLTLFPPLHRKPARFPTATPSSFCSAAPPALARP